MPGRQHDLGPAPDDGVPAANVRGRGGKGAMIVTAILMAVAFVVGGWFGGAALGRRAFNNTNVVAKRVQSEFASLSRTVTSIKDAVAMSQQRMGGNPFGYDYALVGDLEKLPLDIKPATQNIFKLNYYQLPDLVVDNLMNYYYDANALFAEVGEHIKRTKNDKAAIESYIEKQKANAENTAANYGVVFTSTGVLAIANLVELGGMVCADGAEQCAPKDIKGFKIRANAGSSFSDRTAGAKVDGKNVVPIEPTPLFDAVMSGSPEQVLAAAYRERYATIVRLVKRMELVQKELTEHINKAASRPDLFTIF
jgi:hypothetical protein